MDGQRMKRKRKRARKSGGTDNSRGCFRGNKRIGSRQVILEAIADTSIRDIFFSGVLKTSKKAEERAFNASSHRNQNTFEVVLSAWRIGRRRVISHRIIL